MSQKTIYLCGGCFWGVERAFQQLQGVLATEVGYANGERVQPSYEEVCKGQTGHKECVKVDYDPQLISLDTLLQAFFLCIHPEQADGQGNDIGSQYLAAVISDEEETLQTVENFFAEERKKHQQFHVGIERFTSFYAAEEYHQDYLLKHPTGYCHIRPQQFLAIQQLQEEKKA